LHADVWVRGNHVREVTGTEAFVQAVHPRLIVVSGMAGGRDAAPTRTWAQQWRARGMEVWLQQDTGAVEGWGGKHPHVRGYLNGQMQHW